VTGCIADQLGLMGSSSTLTDFAHKCDTKNGSSGTPVQLINDAGKVGAVVGLHHLGVRMDSVDDEAPKQINRAVSTKKIIAYITLAKPALLKELVLQ
jgi:V8-like Glu-specific endopeptidase